MTAPLLFAVTHAVSSSSEPNFPAPAPALPQAAFSVQNASITSLPPLPSALLAAASAHWETQSRATASSGKQRELAAALASLGLAAESEAGVAGYSVDFAVRVPGMVPGVGVVVEMDGPSHFTRNTRQPLGAFAFSTRTRLAHPPPSQPRRVCCCFGPRITPLPAIMRVCACARVFGVQVVYCLGFREQTLSAVAPICFPVCRRDTAEAAAPGGGWVAGPQRAAVGVRPQPPVRSAGVVVNPPSSSPVEPLGRDSLRDHPIPVPSRHAPPFAQITLTTFTFRAHHRSGTSSAGARRNGPRTWAGSSRR